MEVSVTFYSNVTWFLNDSNLQKLYEFYYSGVIYVPHREFIDQNLISGLASKSESFFSSRTFIVPSLIQTELHFSFLDTFLLNEVNKRLLKKNPWFILI